MIDQKPEIVFLEGQVSRTKMKYTISEDGELKGVLTANLPITYRRNEIEGVFNHEIGTHYLRKYNDRKQIWYKNKKAYNLKNGQYMPTEEGLATTCQ